MSALNPSIFSWARETAGLTLEQAARKLGIKPAHGLDAAERLAAYEKGEKAPRPPLITRMARQYHRPVLAFYLPAPPRPANLGEDFRMLSEPVADEEAGWAQALVRDIGARQLIVKSTLEESGDALPLPFIGSMRQSAGVEAVAASIESILEFKRDAFRGQADPRKAFDYARDLAERCGVFVLLAGNLGSWHTRISVSAFRGFALADPIAPFVAVNNNDSHTAMSFTLFHELAHLWLGATGLSGGETARGAGVEKFCNDVASAILFPEREAQASSVNAAAPFEDLKQQITRLASPIKVSSTMVAYRLYQAGAFDESLYRRLAAAYSRDFTGSTNKDKPARGGGPDYYVMRKRAAGSLVRFVDSMLAAGRLSATKAATVLGVPPRKVYPLLARTLPGQGR